MSRLARAGALLALVAGCGPSEFEPVPIEGSRSSGTIAVDPVRHRVVVGGQDVPRVTFIEPLLGGSTWSVELPEGAEPRQVAFSADGKLVYASDWALGQVHVIDLSEAAVSRSVDVGHEPYGVIAGPIERPDVWLASYGRNQLRRFNAVLGSALDEWSLGWGEDSAPIDLEANVSNGWDPRAVVWDAGRNALYVGHQMNARVSKVDLDTGEIDALFLTEPINPDPAVPQGVAYRLDQMAISPDGSRLYVPHILWNPAIAYADGRTVWPAVSVVDLDAFAPIDQLVPGDGLDAEQGGAPAGLANPAAAVVTADGARIVVVFEGSDELAVIDPEAREVTALLRLPGAGPRGLALDPATDTLWVHLALDASVVSVDLADPDAPVIGELLPLAAGVDPLADAGFRDGKRLFHRAWDPDGIYPPSRGEQTACASCHPDGMSRAIRWFILDQKRDLADDARFGHFDSVTGFTATDQDAAVADLVRMFQNVGGLSADAGGVDVDPDAPPAELEPALVSLEEWLHGPDNLPFRGSWANTDDGAPVPAAELVGDEVCGECHAAIYEEYQGSAHANAGLADPFFQAIEADLLEQQDGAFASWCLGCHAPQALVQGNTSFHDGPAPDEHLRGIMCLGCHGVVDFRAAEGNNGMVYGFAQVLAAGFPEPEDDPTAHALAMTIDPSEASYEGKLRLGASGFCGTCHQSYTPGIGVTEFLTYQEYLDSPFHGNEHENEKQCADCHMPEDKGWRDHGFAGPSTWFARQYGTSEHEALNAALMADAATVEIEAPPGAAVGTELLFEVVVRNVGAGHKLPTGVSNLRELWLDVVVEADGVEVFRSGELSSDGSLDPTATRFSKRLFDAQGEPLELHQVWRIGSMIDTTIPAGGFGTARYAVAVPVGADSLEITATLRYRSLPRAIVEHALGVTAEPLEIVDLGTAAADVTVVP